VKEGVKMDTQDTDVELEEPANVGGDGPGQRPVVAEVSRAMVKLYKEQFGRGPTTSHTYWCGDDMLVCVLEDTFTPAELNLRALGELKSLRDTRMLFQYASVRPFVEVVEQITGRTVRSFVSGLDAEEDVSTETFLLYPKGSALPSRSQKPAA
jgi:uncharacterized protein YbcI